MEEEVPAMVVWGYGVGMVTTVIGEARQPSPKSPWLGIERRVFYVGSNMELVPVVINGFFGYYLKLYLFISDIVYAAASY